MIILIIVTEQRIFCILNLLSYYEISEPGMIFLNDRHVFFVVLDYACHIVPLAILFTDIKIEKTMFCSL